MHKLIKRYQVGGGIVSPSSIGQLIQNRDLGIIQQQANLNLTKGLKLPKNSSSLVGKSNFNIGNTMNIAGGIADTLGSFIPQKEQSALTTGLNQGYDMTANAVSAIPGVGTIIGGAMKIGGALSDGLTALGIGTDQMTTADKILDSKFLKLTPLGLINSIGAKKADTMYKDNTTWEQQGSSYGGSLAKVDDAMTKSGKKYGAFSGRGRRAANRQIAEATRQQGVIQGINNKAQDAFLSSSTMSDTNNTRNYINLSGGINFNTIRRGQEGLRFPTKDEVDRARNTLRVLNNQSLPVYKEGGKMNVIPEGALHARLHHMDMEGITKKGIPVITKEDGGEVVQHAEIERDEIIFTKEVTEKLEELYKKGTDEAAIEAGKILAKEIMENTQDNTGLIKTIS